MITVTEGVYLSKEGKPETTGNLQTLAGIMVAVDLTVIWAVSWSLDWLSYLAQGPWLLHDSYVHTSTNKRRTLPWHGPPGPESLLPKTVLIVQTFGFNQVMCTFT